MVTANIKLCAISLFCEIIIARINGKSDKTIFVHSETT
jgi:hypothetical protein